MAEEIVAEENEKDCPCSWGDKAKAIALVITAISGAIVTPIISAITLSKTNNVEATASNVEAVQGEHVKTTEKAAKAATQANEIAAAKTEDISKMATQIQSLDKNIQKVDNVVTSGMAANLEASWKYLQKIADETQLLEDIQNAKVAKKAYDDFVAKYGKNK